MKYIRFMMDQQFANEPMDHLNKGLFAFAAYNAGPGRIRELRQRAARRGLNPNVWFNNVEVVASEAIGRETVQYVANIYKYYLAYLMVSEQRNQREKALKPKGQQSDRAGSRERCRSDSTRSVRAWRMYGRAGTAHSPAFLLQGAFVHWTVRYRRDAFVRSSLWAIPIGCMAAALVVAPVIRWIDDQTRWTLLGSGLDGARAVLGALVASLLTFIVFAFSLLLLAVQVASGQLTPRLIARIFEARPLKLILSVFLLSFAYSLSTLGRFEDRVPQLPVLLAVLLSLVSISLFLYLVQTASRSLRPVSILTRVADNTRRVIEATYPHRFTFRAGEPVESSLNPAHATRPILHRGRSAVVLACDVAGVVEIATRAGCAVELVPQVGDVHGFGSRPRTRSDDLGQGVRREPCTSTDRD